MNAFAFSNEGNAGCGLASEEIATMVVIFLTVRSLFGGCVTHHGARPIPTALVITGLLRSDQSERDFASTVGELHFRAHILGIRNGYKINTHFCYQGPSCVISLPASCDQ
jgi:hypothetical protein